MYEHEVPTLLDGLSCTGNETSLLDCCYIGGRHNCYATIGIECAGSYLHVNQKSVDSICRDDPLAHGLSHDIIKT